MVTVANYMELEDFTRELIAKLAVAYENNPDCGGKPEEIIEHRAKVHVMREKALDGS